MRLRDNPVIEVTRKLACTPEQAWALVTDISLPTRTDGELQRVEWLDGAERVALGARFRGYNRNDQLGEWATDAEVIEVEEGRRWVWSVGPEGGGEAWTSWGFEVDPSRDGALVRQWGRVGDGASPFRAFVAAHPEREARIIEYRLDLWRTAMEANLAALADGLD
ncbi:Cyclase/dehydrase OS=Tsukamurella paurometabola (strain ATCC 8368 / DSM / CCUG 35730 / CIP 100753/ JCM 10117 / KCTC 9821 / NBRC 16120 / NCIMB 702349 /NCTC 13040) OX=521096 GN=Tpau_4005 PE=4 SV=1 [Tsukamurella paurometabola]|uniref:Cyclase/dehydrase n=1 Tax=Tsukamurella paurometabola (strain ATCC 8368 / DSM 20162 / CCUG 35730 / CIP 100753 / JCM 10117 / KCTC 9821 / NBRC 16120 / NCIMB 702349 / NCTC 13040) TaxID=521096 RepID=D5UN81_TSUPD|nr:SRPBCC family protein [Tsukamurella paurometabola]ADG80576.1 cyclase/dehydrase [Tsukamurella paurometabola DSM 20162]SUP40153.1 Polyketide cyclase / dehydrase and lipid transport [Tsukamurella paurometabola]